MKGKEAAAATARKLRAVEDEATRLRFELEQEREGRRAEVADLRAELDTLRGAFTSAVEQAAADRVRDVTAQSAADLAAERAKTRDHDLAVARWMTTHAVGVPDMRVWAALGDVLSIPVGEFLQEGHPDSRKVRRAASRHLNAKVQRQELRAPESFYVRDV